MKASVIIPSRGGADRLPRLLTALAAQTHDDWEAIVVIDGDVDGSEAVVARYAHLPVRSIVFPENRGRVAALNAGHEAATGDVLIRCDDDLEPNPDYVANHVAGHQDGPVGIIGIYLNQLPDNAYARAYGRTSDENHRRDAYAASEDTAWRYWAGNVSVTRETWERVGQYDPRYRAYGWEDIDYGYRIHKAGIPVRIEPALATKHHVAATTAAMRVKRAFHAGAARRLFEQIHQMESASSGSSGSVWERSVRLGGRLGLGELVAAAKFVDGLIMVMPSRIGEKSVALLVQAASLSGCRHSEQVSTDV